MEETHSGNMMAESKKEAMEALRDTAVDDGLSTVRLNNSKYSNQILYKYFDSVAEAERELFGKRASNGYTCDYCGSTFENRGVYISHSNNCSEERVEADKKATNLLSDFYINDEYSVYVLEVIRDDGEKFWYVGMTSQVERRIRKHIRGSNIKMPDKNGRLQEDAKYTISSLEELIPVDDRKRAREIERRKAFELCLEHETLNILGGR